MPDGGIQRMVAAVHTATLQSLGEHGYDGLSLPSIAQRAGVSPSLMLRRWKSKADLIADVLTALTLPDEVDYDTGSLRGDLQRLLTTVASVTAAGDVRSILRAVVAVANDDPQVAAAQTRFWGDRYRVNQGIVERATMRGELPTGIDPHVVLEMAVTPVYFRSMFTEKEVTPDYISDVVDRTIRAFAPEAHA